MRLHRNSNKAVTLIELMVVMTIMSIILGISSAFLSQFNKRLALKGAGQEIRSLLRLSKNYAIESKTKSHLEINGQTFAVKGSRIRGYWHFEKIINNQSQGFGLPANIADCELAQGKIGNALHLSSSGLVNCGESGYFELGEQFAISFWIFLDTVKNGNRAIFSIGENFRLELKSDHNFLLFVQDTEIQTKDFILPLFQWVPLRIECGDSIRILANNVEILQKKCEVPIEISYDAPIVFGKNSPFYLDEVGIFSFVELERYTLPEHIVVENNIAKISFDRSGRLHPLEHLSPTSILLKEKRTEQILAVETSLMGNFTVTDESDGK